MKIAIIDGVNQDIGLKILFPGADYFINNTEVDKTNSHDYYKIKINTDWSIINDKNYDYLFIVIAMYDAKIGTKFFKQNIYDILQREINIINDNNFKKVFIFDNYDYDYDPNEILNNNKINLYFKRNYNKTKKYNENVVPFPFIMFGDLSLIEKCDKEFVSKEEYFKEKENRVFFSGTLFNHEDSLYPWYRNRYNIYDKIKDTIYNPGNLNYSSFINVLRNSKYSLDLLGVGDPNKRTFEILLSGSLILSEKNNLYWPFEEKLNEEVIFSDSDDYFKKLINLENNNELYNKCLINQYNITNKYFNIKWIKEYIIKYIVQ
jgi:hypothetical protein